MRPVPRQPDPDYERKGVRGPRSPQESLALPKLAGWKRYDPLLWIIVAAFVVFELVAHFGFHNATGWQTLSNRTLAFERRFGWPARALVAVALGLLAAHLEGAF